MLLETFFEVILFYSTGPPNVKKTVPELLSTVVPKTKKCSYSKGKHLFKVNIQDTKTMSQDILIECLMLTLNWYLPRGYKLFEKMWITRCNFIFLLVEIIWIITFVTRCQFCFLHTRSLAIILFTLSLSFILTHLFNFFICIFFWFLFIISFCSSLFLFLLLNLDIQQSWKKENVLQVPQQTFTCLKSQQQKQYKKM